MDTESHIAAYADDISPWVSPAHKIDKDRVKTLAEYIRAGGTLPPVLVIEDQGNGAVVLDGHHRCAAYRALDIQCIRAWVVSVDDLAEVLHVEFNGEMPSRRADLDDYIYCGGQPYARPE